MTNQIIDIYHGNDVNWDELVSGGCVAVIHKCTEGASYHDPLYWSRRTEALNRGLLWGAYHFSSAEDVETQVNNFLVFCNPSPKELIALDWEPSSNGGKDMNLNQVHTFCSLVRAKLGRWPLLYGGHLIREGIGTNPDPILSQCPLWYARYATTPKGIPHQVWPTYTLWQYTDGDSGIEPHDTPGCDGADRNIFDGSIDDLKIKWPFNL